MWRTCCGYRSLRSLNSAADTALTLAARFWFLMAAAGQLIFPGVCRCLLSRNGNPRTPRNLERGHPPRVFSRATLSSVAVAVHLSLAVVILVGGPLQLLPQLRRWNGRLYMLTVFVTSIAGLYMVWSRGRTDLVQRVGISVDAARRLCQ